MARWDRDRVPERLRDPSRRGRRLVEERVAYFALVDAGMGVREAARTVGINYGTAKTWSAAARAAAIDQAVRAVANAAGQEISARFLSADERVVIADRLREKTSIRSIAAQLGRAPSTISRERHRNRQPDGGYAPHAAHALAAARRPRPKISKIAADPGLRSRVQDGLDQRWSPQQIARRLRRDHPQRPEWHVTHETIYQALYIQARGGLRREVVGWLRTGRAQRRPHRQADARLPRMATPMVMISDRPAEVADRAVPGHWEGDLIIGAGNKSAIGTLVERTTRFVVLLHLPEGYAPSLVRDALVAAAHTLPVQVRRSLTWDQGSEMHYHHQFTMATQMPVYFCDPHSPWQRGSNENTNGLLRQYFPKGTDLSVHSREQLDAVAAQLNGRPRMTLGYDTPAERLATLLATEQPCCDDR
jgi:IS30 family transposase